MNLPHFDEWFKAKNAGLSFEELHQQPGMAIGLAMEKLSREMRDYVSEMAQGLHREAP